MALSALQDIQRIAAIELLTWTSVSANIPAWHPRNESVNGEVVEEGGVATAEDELDARAKAKEEHVVDVSDMDPGEIGKRLGRAEAENQRLKREKADREKEARKQRAQAKANEDQRKAEQGEWKKLAEERADRVLELEGELRTLRSGIEDGRRRDMVTKVADKVGFHNPARAYALLREDFNDEDKLSETLESDQLVEAALRRMAKDEPYLVDRTRRTGAGMSGRSGGGPKDPAKEHNELISALLGGAVVQSIE